MLIEEITYSDLKQKIKSSDVPVLGLSSQQDSGTGFLLEEVIKNVKTQLCDIQVYKIKNELINDDFADVLFHHSSSPILLIFSKGELQNCVVGLIGVDELKRQIFALHNQ